MLFPCNPFSTPCNVYQALMSVLSSVSLSHPSLLSPLPPWDKAHRWMQDAVFAGSPRAETENQLWRHEADFSWALCPPWRSPGPFAFLDMTHCRELPSPGDADRHGLWQGLVAQTVKNLPAMKETQVLGEGKSPGEGNGNPLQYSGLENPMDGGAWWATVYGVTDEDLTDPRDPGRSCGLRVLPAANTAAIRHFYTKSGFACVWQDSPGLDIRFHLRKILNSFSLENCYSFPRLTLFLEMWASITCSLQGAPLTPV